VKGGAHLETALRNWRTAEAKKHGGPPFRIFADRTLLAIAEARPSNVEELLAIPGIGINSVQNMVPNFTDWCTKMRPVKR